MLVADRDELRRRAEARGAGDQQRPFSAPSLAFRRILNTPLPAATRQARSPTPADEGSREDNLAWRRWRGLRVSGPDGVIRPGP